MHCSRLSPPATVAVIGIVSYPISNHAGQPGRVKHLCDDRDGRILVLPMACHHASQRLSFLISVIPVEQRAFLDQLA